ncbi:MAG: hypothetical protein EZS28_029391, partial [Streblomastix strix]
TKVDKSKGKKRTGGAIKKIDPEQVSLALSISCKKRENTEDNSYKSNAISLYDCSFAEKQQFENDEKIMEQGSSNDGDDEKDDDTNAKKNLEKSYNKHVVNNQAGDDCFFALYLLHYTKVKINSKMQERGMQLS